MGVDDDDFVARTSGVCSDGKSDDASSLCVGSSVMSSSAAQRGAEKMISSGRDQIESSGACSREDDKQQQRSDRVQWCVQPRRDKQHQIDHIIAFHDLF